MADLKRCTTCGALTLPDDVKFHAADHIHYDTRLDKLTRKNTDYLQEIAHLREDIASYSRQLEDHPISMAPETINVTDAPTFDPDDLLDDVRPSDDPDDITTSTYADDDVNATVAMDPADLPTPAHDAISNLYTPRP